MGFVQIAADGKIILPVPVKHTDDAAIGDRKKRPAFAVRHVDALLSSLHPTSQKRDDLVPLDALLQLIDESDVRHCDALHGENVVHRHSSNGFFLGKSCVQNLV